MNLYLDTEAYQGLVVGFASELPVCRYTGGLDVEGAKRQLGERLGIWPATIRHDAQANGHE